MSVITSYILPSSLTFCLQEKLTALGDKWQLNRTAPKNNVTSWVTYYFYHHRICLFICSDGRQQYPECSHPDPKGLGAVDWQHRTTRCLCAAFLQVLEGNSLQETAAWSTQHPGKDSMLTLSMQSLRCFGHVKSASAYSVIEGSVHVS